MTSTASKPPFSIGGYIASAVAAPGLAFVICILGASSAALIASSPLDEANMAIISLIVMFFLVTVWGVLPSLVFGGVVLAVMQKLPWRGPVSALAFMAGGMVAAGLYVLSALGVERLSRGGAMAFAPWAGSEPMLQLELWWIVCSLVLAGAGAGLIYARCVKRG